MDKHNFYFLVVSRQRKILAKYIIRIQSMNMENKIDM